MDSVRQRELSVQSKLKFESLTVAGAARILLPCQGPESFAVHAYLWWQLEMDGLNLVAA